MSSIVAKALHALQGNAQFVVYGTEDNYTIDWHSSDIEQPSEEELENAIKVIKAEVGNVSQ